MGRIPEKKVESTKPLVNISLAVDHDPVNISKPSRGEIHHIAYKDTLSQGCVQSILAFVNYQSHRMPPLPVK